MVFTPNQKCVLTLLLLSLTTKCQGINKYNIDKLHFTTILFFFVLKKDEKQTKLCYNML